MIDELASQYRAEETRLNESRLLAWSTVSGFVSLIGVDCEPLTARAWVDLKLVSNRLVTGGEPTIGDVAAYIWRVSTGYRTGNGWLARRGRKKIARAICQAGDDAAYIAVCEHLGAAFEEIPQSGSVNGGTNRNNGVEDVIGIVGAVDEVANRYGTSPDLVIEWPMNRIFQLQKALRLATIEGYKLRQPETIMRLRSEYLNILNDGKS